MRSLLIFVLLFLSVALPALAVDGVREINQTCAVTTGCFAGDTAGFPVTITTPGSYRLTSNLVVANASTDGILISFDEVRIDLNDFAIVGGVTCSGIPLACTEYASGSGVEVTNLGLPGVSVRNGSIRGMGAYGVYLGEQAEVTNVRARWNAIAGISVSVGSTVSENAVSENGDKGISASNGTVVSGNTAYMNRGIGISVGNGLTVLGNTAYLNGGDGIRGGAGLTISGNTAYENGGDGIEVSLGATVSGNTVRRNAGFGLNFGLFSGSGYRENVISSNTLGTVTGTGMVNLGDNACNGVICP